MGMRRSNRISVAETIGAPPTHLPLPFTLHVGIVYVFVSISCTVAVANLYFSG